MKFFLFKIYLLFIILYGFVFAQEDKVVAKIGDYKIYESEFKDRFDFSAHPKLLNNTDKEVVKHEFLEQLIAEKLLALDAMEKGFSGTKQFNDIIGPLENMYVRDALYNLEIKDKIEYSPEKIKNGLDRIKKKLKLKFIFSDNENELKNIYQKLKEGASFDSLLALRKESKDQDTLRVITFGDMDKKVEDEVYRLKQGEFTPIISSVDGYYILKLDSIQDNKDLKDNANTLEDVKRIIETRIEHEKYLEYYRGFFSKYKVTADKKIFEKLIEIFVPKFADKYAVKNPEDHDNKFYLRGGEVSSAIYLIDNTFRNMNFINFKNKFINVEYFLNKLSQDGFFVQDISEKSIRASLSSYIRKFIEDELLTMEGVKKGLKNSKEVQKNINMWRDYYLSQMLMTSLMDSVKVPEEEVYSVYLKNEWNETSPQLVNIVEILTDKLEVVETVLKELSKGKDIRELAKQYTIRDSLRNRGGEFGYFPITKFGNLGKIASQMKIGEVYGPIKLDEGYSVFQLIGSETDTTTYEKSFDEIKQELKMKLTLSKFEKLVNKYNAQLANKYGVKIYEDVLKSINNIFLNLVVVKNMGFGGEIFAVPYTEQFSGWFDVWQKSKNLSP